MRKAFDIIPPRSRSGTHGGDLPGPKAEQDFSTLEVQPHDWHVPAATTEIAPIDTSARPGFGRLAILLVRQAGMYLIVGMISFFFFSALFYGYNLYQDRQREMVAQEDNRVAGVATDQVATLNIRILNGSGSFEQLNALRDALEKKSYRILASGNAAQPSERTVIYYKTSQEEAALKLASDISQFAPSLQKNDDLVAVDDIIILLGSLPDIGIP